MDIIAFFLYKLWQYTVDLLSAIMGAFIVLYGTSIHVYELLPIPVVPKIHPTILVDVVCRIQFISISVDYPVI